MAARFRIAAKSGYPTWDTVQAAVGASGHLHSGVSRRE